MKASQYTAYKNNGKENCVNDVSKEMAKIEFQWNNQK